MHPSRFQVGVDLALRRQATRPQFFDRRLQIRDEKPDENRLLGRRLPTGRRNPSAPNLEQGSATCIKNSTTLITVDEAQTNDTGVESNQSRQTLRKQTDPGDADGLQHEQVTSIGWRIPQAVTAAPARFTGRSSIG